MAYGIATNNPFALLGGDEENDDPQKIQVPAQPVAPVKTEQPPSQPAQGARGRGGRGRSDRGGRSGRLGGRGGRGGRSNYDNRGFYDSAEQGYDGDVPPVSRGGGRHGGRGRGRGGDGGYRGGKRDFDRRDQSGRGHELEKRGGGGKGNWGGATDWDETPAEEAPPTTDLNGEALPAEGEQAADGEGQEGAQEVTEQMEEEEKPPEKYTLAEYEEMMKEKMLTKTVQKVKADTKWSEGLAEIKKDEVETGFESLEMERTRRTKQKAKKEFIPVETGFRVGDPVRRGRGGARGSGRGRSRDFDREGSGRLESQYSGDGDQGNTSYGSGYGSGGGSFRGRGSGRRGGSGGGGPYGSSYGGRRGDRQSGSGGYGGYSSQPKQPDMADQASFPSLS